ncbi:uncharacterized protein MYCFIDRAFT_129232 [Pseudocercospora fijiensis CIRAD86]|uniref:Uncharacterized protein n=1 Tax=Pseudocercospora fijiensis (strain CIRAD86) TaxID=383855 RepID=N1QCB1_PSEFD|nr:uncharacterized protein MYCFIDRAFT_129232 [Pseudocercospora fijiensis CIRAD86]EME89102.1 hypothetical protein MYCFIDRAFT_129232 [Pseudocercospora fijiensis CIRAD86]
MRFWFAREWRIPKIFIGLMILEFPLTVAMLALMGIAHPNTYRTKLWQNGFDANFNSAPNSILYDYANWRPAHIPLIWSRYMTQFNVVISILSMFVLLAKSAMYVMHIFIPALSVFCHALLVALYSVSVYNQSRPDTSDKDLPSLSMPWYLSKGCKHAEPGNKGYCLQARASFAVTIVMLVLFIAYLGYSAWNCIPTQREKIEREAEYQSNLEMKKLSIEKNRQLFLNLPKTPNTPGFGVHNPMTPRTVAFTQLNGGVSSAGPSRSLPFRELSYELQSVQVRSKGMPDAR